MRRSREILFATVLLLLAAGFTFLYSGIVPLLPGIVNQPQPIGATALAGVALVAAIGVWRLNPWGRWLGAAVGLVMLASAIAFVASGQLFELSSVALDLFLIWLLLRRWPATTT